jgi:predicted metalloprotease
VTLADTEKIWDEIFETQVGGTYTSPTLVLFKDATQSPYGGAMAQSGPRIQPSSATLPTV